MNIGIIGQMASGKTTYSKHIVDNYNYTRISLAEPIYWVVDNLKTRCSADIYNIYLDPYIEPELTLIKKINFISCIDFVRTIPDETPKPRKRLQWFGTEGGRNNIRDSIWIDIFLTRVKQNPDIKFVVDDVRFGNERDALSNAGFHLIKLNIDKETQKSRLEKLYGNFDETILAHGSEIEIKGLAGDTTIDTTGPLKTSLSNLDEVLKGIS